MVSEISIRYASSVADSLLTPKGSVSTVPNVQVLPVSGSAFGLPVCTSISNGKNIGLWRVQPFGPGPSAGLDALKVCVSNSDVELPMSSRHNCCTFARFALLATLPHGASVVAEQGSSCGKNTTACVGPWNNSATLGARVAALEAHVNE